MLRHSYSTLLRANGTDIKVQQELLRHSNVQTTLQIYTQAVSEQGEQPKRMLWGSCLGREIKRRQRVNQSGHRRRRPVSFLC